MAKFDAANPPGPDQAKQLFAQVAQLLGLDPNSLTIDEFDTAIDSLLEAAGVTAPTNTSPPPEADDDGSEGDGAEGIAPDNRQPKVTAGVDPDALKRGRKIMGMERPPERTGATPGVSKAAIERGRRMLGWDRK